MHKSSVYKLNHLFLEVKFKLKATVIEELPEAEIEAETREEAEEKYSQMYELGELEGEFYDIDFGSDDSE